MNREIFFSYLRKSKTGFGKSLSQKQVDGLNRLLDVWAHWYAAKYPLVYLAACMGQIYRETGGLMWPILETHNSRHPTTSREQAARKLESAFKAGKLKWVKTRYWLKDESGQIGVGGGDIQLTHRDNYVRANSKLLDLFGVNCGLDVDYDRILHPVISAHVAFSGMIHGWFTGKKLEQYMRPAGKLDYRSARDIVNGDKNYQATPTLKIGEQIERLCKMFEAALKESGADASFGLPENPQNMQWPGYVKRDADVIDEPDPEIDDLDIDWEQELADEAKPKPMGNGTKVAVGTGGAATGAGIIAVLIAYKDTVSEIAIRIADRIGHYLDMAWPF